MEELVLKAQNGNTEAYTKLMLEIKNDLYKICKARITSDDEIEDIIQETMIQTFQNIKKLRSPEKFKAWIITILINNCNKMYKRKSKLKLINIDTYLKSGVQNTSSINNIEMLEEDMNFYQLISHLKYEERIIIILYYSEQFTIKEISQILHLNVSTVKSRLYRSKEKIKKECKGGMQIG